MLMKTLLDSSAYLHLFMGSQGSWDLGASESSVGGAINISSVVNPLMVEKWPQFNIGHCHDTIASRKAT